MGGRIGSDLLLLLQDRNNITNETNTNGRRTKQIGRSKEGKMEGRQIES